MSGFNVKRRGCFAGLDRFWDLNLISESEDSFLHGLRTAVLRLVWEGNVRHSVINFSTLDIAIRTSDQSLRPTHVYEKRVKEHTRKNVVTLAKGRITLGI